jgi:hypothetical protein
VHRRAPLHRIDRSSPRTRGYTSLPFEAIITPIPALLKLISKTNHDQGTPKWLG